MLIGLSEWTLTQIEPLKMEVADIPRGSGQSPSRRVRMRRVLDSGFELDDDPNRVDVAAVHDFLSNHAPWALVSGLGPDDGSGYSIERAGN